MAKFYHLIFPGGFEGAIGRHAEMLGTIIEQHGGGEVRSILDVSCGIGTQTLGLAQRGYQVTASDLSPQAIERARREAEQRGLDIPFSVVDMRQAYQYHQTQFDLVLSADNAIPHLLNDADIQQAFTQFYHCCRPGGGCLITVRDYEAEDLTSGQVRPYGLREAHGRRYLIFQVWDFHEPLIYEVSMYFVEDDGTTDCKTHVMRTKYYAISTGRLIDLMTEAGFEGVQRLDGVYFQPVLIGFKKEI